MAKQTINIGAAPNDGTGTPLRTSFDYCNQNFTELYTATGPSGNNIVSPGTITSTGDTFVGGNLFAGNTTSPYPARAFLQLSDALPDGVVVRNSNATAGKYWRTCYVNNLNTCHILNQGGVGVYLTDGATSWTGTSDERLKDIIEPINNAVSKVSSLRSVIGKYKNDSEGTRRSFLIAQDVQSVLPEAVDSTNSDALGVRYTEVIPLLVAAIKELTARVQMLESK